MLAFALHQFLSVNYLLGEKQKEEEITCKIFMLGFALGQWDK